MKIFKILKSRTILLGILQIGAALIAYAQGQIAVGGSLTMSGILMIIMRVITTQPLSEK